MKSSCSCFGEQIEGAKHPQFMFMCVISQEGLVLGLKLPSLLRASTNPHKRIHEFNTKATDDRIAKKGAPYWELELVIGPFAEGARQLAVDWSLGSRKLVCRIQAGIQLTCRVNACLEQQMPPGEIKSKLGCLPETRLHVWARDKEQLIALLSETKVKTRKRPRVAQPD